jgi:tetratricopeptide (TPR) repeat protein
MKHTAYIIVGLLLLLTGSAAAGDGGTQSPFSLGAGARDLALGGSGLNSPDPVTAVYWNPSALACVERISLGGFHSRLFQSGAAYQYLGVAVPTMDFGGFGFGLFRLGVDGIEERDADNVSHGEISDSRIAMYLGYGRTISDYDVGLALALEHHSIGDHSGTSSPGLNLSISRTFELTARRITGISAGVAVRNLVRPRIKLVSESVGLPAELDGSVAAGFLPNPGWNHIVTVSAGFRKVEGIDAQVTGGIDYDVQGLLHIRGGLRDERFSFGAGVSYGSISFDYALVERDFGSLHMFSIGTALGRPVSEKRRLREVRRETEFNELLGRSLSERNIEMVSGLLQRGKELAKQGSFDEAAVALDRAMFLAEGSGLDTSAVYTNARKERLALSETVLTRRFEADMDSAWTRLNAGAYLDARYFAIRALSGFPDSEAAKDVLEKIDERIDRSTASEAAIEQSILRADSLTSYGRFDEALAVAKALEEMAPADERIKMTIRKAEFGLWKETAERALSRSDYGSAQAAVDSALARFPAHPWGLMLTGRIREETIRAVAESAELEEEVPKELSAELRSEVEEAYKQGQSLFENGKLTYAVARWEKVEALAPGYRSVRRYLVDAYKFLGVELYTQNRLEEAVEIWKKAAKLDPDSAEIANYIRRTQGEISRLQEISYDFE